MRYCFSLVLLVVLPLQADVYKCTVNNTTMFSDQPCSDNAERIEIKTTPPATVDVETQQTITATFEEEARVSEVTRLNKENDDIEAEIIALQQQREADLESLRERTYQLDDGRMATSEPGLFDKMNQVMIDTKQKIEALHAVIRANEFRLSELHQPPTAVEKP